MVAGGPHADFAQLDVSTSNFTRCGTWNVSEAVHEAPKIEVDGLPGFGLIAETLHRFRSQRGELEEFVEAIFVAFEDLGARLTRRQDLINQREAELNERQQQLSARQSENEVLRELLQQQEARLESVTAELQRIYQELSEQRAGLSTGDSDGQLQAAMVKLEEQRDDLRERLDVCREELAKRADSTELLATTQAELAAARSEILQLQQKLQERSDADHTDSDAEQERVALETELEMVRRRAAELSESLAEQKDQMKQQQAVWSSELKILRQLVEAQSAVASARPVEETAGKETAASESARVTQAVPKSNDGENPVVDSIMEQFAKLQKDVAQRRKRKVH